jgi:hypothetical protein
VPNARIGNTALNIAVIRIQGDLKSGLDCLVIGQFQCIAT